MAVFSFIRVCDSSIPSVGGIEENPFSVARYIRRRLARSLGDERILFHLASRREMGLGDEQKEKPISLSLSLSLTINKVKWRTRTRCWLVGERSSSSSSEGSLTDALALTPLRI